MRYGTVKITRPDWWLAALQQHAIAARFEVAFFTEFDNTILGWGLSILALAKIRSKTINLKHGGNGGINLRKRRSFKGVSQTVIRFLGAEDNFHPRHEPIFWFLRSLRFIPPFPPCFRFWFCFWCVHARRGMMDLLPTGCP